MLASLLAPNEIAAVPALAGFRLASLCCNLRYRNRDDCLLIECAPGTTVAGVFTRSLTAAAPVLLCRTHLAAGEARAILVNAGNANAFTGQAGIEAAWACATALAEALGCTPEKIFPASTGVIGEPLDYKKILAVIPKLVAGLTDEGWHAAAAAIMTTDTFPKQATCTAMMGGRKITINGIAKGSGMIAPDMATMLGFVATDAAIPAPMLQQALEKANAASFNCITVDGDTSTNDTLLLLASGRAGNLTPDERDLAAFAEALERVLIDLACQVVRDGEGASKFITIEVTGAQSDQAARRIGLAIGNSPLVKTAIAGEDANWGRIVMAVGKSGEAADRDRLRIAIGGVAVAAQGMRVPDYDEEPVTRHMRGREIHMAVDVGVGQGQARIWTCDLTHRYIDINADYRS
ncbi:MAG TPA: bifunctional glutamate N-acetyltransferase/amino-acid acetyltransferase ArgJ [Dongiaceae bacterium]|nr:bifunctional glutamate N-acetyltransferase/amino-acid acetyltransferase ArgJ [Dongiaceae bacterium]